MIIMKFGLPNYDSMFMTSLFNPPMATGRFALIPLSPFLPWLSSASFSFSLPSFPPLFLPLLPSFISPLLSSPLFFPLIPHYSSPVPPLSLFHPRSLPSPLFPFPPLLFPFSPFPLLSVLFFHHP